MKNAFIIIALVVAAGFTAAAQTTDELRSQAMEQTHRMMQDYHLSEASYMKLKELNLNYLKQQVELQERFGNDAPLLATRQKAAKAAYDRGVRALMPAEQYALYQKQGAQPEAVSGR